MAGLVADGVAGRVAAGDATLWPSHSRPGWVDAARAARPVGGEIEALRDTFRTAGTTRVVVVGDVGTAAAALAWDAPRLVVLDTPDPVRVAEALAGDLETTVLVAVGAGPVTEAVTAVVQQALVGEGLDAGAHTVRVGSGPVAAGPSANSPSYPGGVADPTGLVPDAALVVAGPADLPSVGAVAAVVVPAPDDVDGPWAVLSPRALVPVGLAGADVRALITDAAAARPALTEDSPDNPALVLGALLAGADAVALSGSDAVDWVVELLAGLGPTGPLPLRTDDAPPGALTVRLDGRVAGGGVAGDGDADVTTSGPPGAQVLLWQHAVAVAAHLLGVDPTGTVTAAPRAGNGGCTFTDGGVDAAGGSWLRGRTVADALRELTADGGHLAVQAWLDRDTDASAAVLAGELSRRVGVTTTFAWAPAAAPGSGPVLLLSGGTDGNDEPVDPELARLHHELARAEAAALAAAGRPVLALHLHDRLAGLVTVARAVETL